MRRGLRVEVSLRTLAIVGSFLLILLGEAMFETVPQLREWLPAAIGGGVVLAYLLGQWSKSP